MKIINIATFNKLLLGNKHKIGAIDMGTVNIGLAIADETKTSVTPRGSIERISPRNGKDSLARLSQRLQKFVTEHKITGFVVGIPLHNNELTPWCNEIIDVVESLRIHCNGFADVRRIDNEDNQVLATFWDESRSSLAAKAITRTYFSQKSSTAMKQKDAFAACVILKNYINAA